MRRFLTALLHPEWLNIVLAVNQAQPSPTDAALILGLEAVFAVLAAWLILKQTLFPVQIIGCIMIFVAVLVSQFKGWTSGKIEHDHLVEGK